MIEQATESILMISTTTLNRRGLHITANLAEIDDVLATDVSDRDAGDLAELTSDLRLV